MNRRRILSSVASTGFAALILLLVLGRGVAYADSDVPSTLLFEGGVASNGGVLVICVVVILAVALGTYLIRRARAKRRTSGRDGGL